ncbi:hypothetical protein NN561_003606 [Cricetulus griseus]
MSGRARVRARGIIPGHGAREVGCAPGDLTATSASPGDSQSSSIASPGDNQASSIASPGDNQASSIASPGDSQALSSGTSSISQPHDDGGRTFTERGKVRRDVIDLSVCTREKLAHVKDCKAGSSGIPLQLVTNLFSLDLPQDWQLYQYHVTYSPDLASRRLRIALLYSHSKLLDKAKAFDGTILFLSEKLDLKVTELTSETQRGETVTITLTLTTQLSSSSPVCIQFFSVIFRKLSLWPGFAVSVSRFESRLLLNADVSYKVLRNETVLEFMTDLCLRTGMSHFTETCQKQLVGLIVLTRYNNKTYRIDDIDWSVKPTHAFQKRDGSEITYMDYYKQQYNITLSDLNQPVLVSLLKRKRKDSSEPQMVHLVPELCFLTGLSSQATSDFHLMKAVAEETRLSPVGRQQQLARLVDDIQSIKVDEKPAAFLRAIQLHVNPDVQLVMCILPSNPKNYYDSIKKYLSSDCPVPSQCVLTRTLTKQGMMMSVATKIAMQMTCKLGGELWAVEIPLKSLMVAGIDICRDALNKDVVVVGFVASINSRITRYDFYLVSQTANRGTVSPTYYNIIYDDNGLKPDHMQRLTFKLCHLYYNWQMSCDNIWLFGVLLASPSLPLTPTLLESSLFISSPPLLESSLFIGSPPLLESSLFIGSPPLLESSLFIGTPPLLESSLFISTPLLESSLFIGSPPLLESSLFISTPPAGGPHPQL